MLPPPKLSHVHRLPGSLLSHHRGCNCLHQLVNHGLQAQPPLPYRRLLLVLGARRNQLHAHDLGAQAAHKPWNLLRRRWPRWRRRNQNELHFVSSGQSFLRLSYGSVLNGGLAECLQTGHGQLPPPCVTFHERHALQPSCRRGEGPISRSPVDLNELGLRCWGDCYSLFLSAARARPVCGPPPHASCFAIGPQSFDPLHAVQGQRKRTDERILLRQQEVVQLRVRSPLKPGVERVHVRLELLFVQI
mmetsp:Transcript_78935/g.157732  ORF Transcript_78935/g.157732 Transcript_78935/m.157732 type:complete len:246 (+) Transcript_78935:2208-2945(+)